MNALERATVMLSAAMRSSDSEMVVVYAAGARTALSDARQELVQLDTLLLKIEAAIKRRRPKELGP